MGTLLIILIVVPLALRYLGRLMQAGDARAVGERLERDVDRTTRSIWEWTKGMCGAVLIVYLIALVCGVIVGICYVVVGWIGRLF